MGDLRVGRDGEEGENLVDYDLAWVSVLGDWSLDVLFCCW